MEMGIRRIGINCVQLNRNFISRNQTNSSGNLYLKIRTLSSSSTTDNKENTEKVVSVSRWGSFEENKGKIFYGSIGLVTFYGISRIMYDMTYQFMSLTPAVSLYYGFIGGCVSSITCAGLGYSVYESMSINPDRAFRMANRIVLQNENLRSLLGGQGKVADSLKTYKSIAGGVSAEKGSMAWRKAELHMLFAVQGPKGEAVVSVLVKKHGFRDVLEFLGVDVIHPQTSRLLLIGSEEKTFSLFEHYRKFLSTF